MAKQSEYQDGVAEFLGTLDNIETATAKTHEAADQSWFTLKRAAEGFRDFSDKLDDAIKTHREQLGPAQQAVNNSLAASNTKFSELFGDGTGNAHVSDAARGLAKLDELNRDRTGLVREITLEYVDSLKVAADGLAELLYEQQLDRADKLNEDPYREFQILREVRRGVEAVQP